MLSRIKNLAWRSRRGAVALVVPLALALPASASAAAWGSVYYNQARAISFLDGQNSIDVKFSLRQVPFTTITVINRVVARADRCHNCSAVAIGFQVLFAAGQGPADVNADNAADAINNSCSACSTLAAAYQIVYVGGAKERLTRQQKASLEQIRTEVLSLRHSSTPIDQIQSQLAQLANQAVSILQATPDNAAPAVTPAVTPVADLGRLAEDSKPVVDLFIKFQHPTH